MLGNVIVGQSGGPTAVINASLAGVYKTAFFPGDVLDAVYSAQIIDLVLQFFVLRKKLTGLLAQVFCAGVGITDDGAQSQQCHRRQYDRSKHQTLQKRRAGAIDQTKAAEKALFRCHGLHLRAVLLFANGYSTLL